VTPLRFEAARQCVIERVSAAARRQRVQLVGLECALGRVLAEDVHADRAYPPYARSIRDGFAVRAETFNGRARVIGEVRAGEVFSGKVNTGEAVEIMTGAPLPLGVDAVVMVEHVDCDGDFMSTNRAVTSGDFIAPEASDCSAGERVLAAGHRLDFASIAVLATVGATQVSVFDQPKVAVVGTGDELTSPEERPHAHQIRNSNSYSLAAQVAAAGGRASIAPIARDTYEATRSVLEPALDSDLLLISGGVSAGKYDIVEKVLSDLGAEFYFDRALIQPGQPVVFGRIGDTFFFGLPGNPASTMVTFEVFAKAALQLIAGSSEAPLGLFYGRLAQELKHRPGLTRFLPATLSGNSPEVTPVRYSGSGDVFAIANANCFVVAREDRADWATGDLIEVLPR
jgi:molybdopterin molybdotransferase